VSKSQKLVLVQWDDAASVTSAWQKEVGVVGCETVGFLVKKDKKEVVIAHTLASDGDFGGKFAIPRGMVKVIKIVR
jgi:hypothetical protein